MALSEDAFSDGSPSQDAPPRERPQESGPSLLTQIVRGIRALCWGLTILASVGAGAFVATHFWVARSGDQQVAVVGLGLLLVAVPYAIAQSVSELSP